MPEKHYMVDISEKLDQITKEFIDTESYFTINRPRQYGKTTTLFMLKKKLKDTYTVLSLSFEGLGETPFQTEGRFVQTFISMVVDNIKEPNSAKILEDAKDQTTDFHSLSKLITKVVTNSDRGIILMIDEVDLSSNYLIFLNFLGMLRNKYLLRNQGEDQTFHSVILAGVHDIKTIKAKIRANTLTDDHNGRDKGNHLNSPWNIAVDFPLDMTFNSKEIALMLQDFSVDRNVRMDILAISGEIYFYTSGHPFLVSRICEIIDTKLHETDAWEISDIEEAVKLILQESNTNFDSLIKNLENNEELYRLVKSMIIDGEKLAYNTDNPVINFGIMYGVFKKQGAVLTIHNRVYEQRIYNYMSSKMETSSLRLNDYNFPDNFITKSTLNMEHVLLKFQQFMREQYSTRDEKFWERQGKIILLAFIKPIINGKGFDFKEVQISEEQRLDVVITFMRKKYVLELKIWHGPESHEKGLLQLERYLENQGLKQGYLVIFNFNKKPVEWTEKRIAVGDKEIFMVVV